MEPLLGCEHPSAHGAHKTAETPPPPLLGCRSELSELKAETGLFPQGPAQAGDRHAASLALSSMEEPSPPQAGQNSEKSSESPKPSTPCSHRVGEEVLAPQQLGVTLTQSLFWASASGAENGAWSPQAHTCPRQQTSPEDFRTSLVSL